MVVAGLGVVGAILKHGLLPLACGCVGLWQWVVLYLGFYSSLCCLLLTNLSVLLPPDCGSSGQAASFLVSTSQTSFGVCIFFGLFSGVVLCLFSPVLFGLFIEVSVLELSLLRYL
ncbi:unnamed protein product [Arabis nemorensis]|uniref:Uncharacterized protein n=1 Tax=Arabis nemorensis TaxID=586526 RepID=A0A565C432_9BRAS|nr:unnamed protein product [Arabis nemorensis]